MYWLLLCVVLRWSFKVNIKLWWYNIVRQQILVEVNNKFNKTSNKHIFHIINNFRNKNIKRHKAIQLVFLFIYLFIHNIFLSDPFTFQLLRCTYKKRKTKNHITTCYCNVHNHHHD